MIESFSTVFQQLENFSFFYFELRPSPSPSRSVAPGPALTIARPPLTKRERRETRPRFVFNACLCFIDPTKSKTEQGQACAGRAGMFSRQTPVL
jgi:hypothetical protein